MFSRTLLAAVPAALLIAAAGPATPGHAETWAGSINAGTAPPSLEFCPAGDVTVLGGGSHDIDVSGPSVLTAFKAENIGVAGAPLTFRVARMESSPTTGRVGWKLFASVPATLGAGGSVTVPARIRVQNTDRLALTRPAGSQVACAMHLMGESPFVATAPGLVPDGSVAEFTTVFDRITPFAARIEDDVDEDGFGDDSQDRCIGQAGKAKGCPPGRATRRRCRVPDVVGLMLPIAKKRLAAGGCRAGVVRRTGRRGSVPFVTGQSRRPRTSAPARAKVDLVLGARPGA